jgi:hypothetical protein
VAVAVAVAAAGVAGAVAGAVAVAVAVAVVVNTCWSCMRCYDSKFSLYRKQYVDSANMWIMLSG